MAAQRVDLGARLSTIGLAGDVVTFQLDPVGTRAVFVVDDAAGPEYALAPDGRTVAYVAEENVTEQLELFARAIDGSGDSIQLSPAPVAGGDVHGIAITPDGTRVVYRGELARPGEIGLYLQSLARF